MKWVVEIVMGEGGDSKGGASPLWVRVVRKAQRAFLTTKIHTDTTENDKKTTKKFNKQQKNNSTNKHGSEQASKR